MDYSKNFRIIERNLRCLKNFRIMERNLKEFVNSDRTHLPSDGGLYLKFHENDKTPYDKTNDILQQTYHKKASKILQPVIREYIDQKRNRPLEMPEYIDLNEYLNMTCQDIYDRGMGFSIPITNKVRYNGKEYTTSLDFLYSFIFTYLESRILFYAPDFTTNTEKDYPLKEGDFSKHMNYILPPLPVEYLYYIKEEILQKYVIACIGDDDLLKQSERHIGYPNETLHSVKTQKNNIILLGSIGGGRMRRYIITPQADNLEENAKKKDESSE